MPKTVGPSKRETATSPIESSSPSRRLYWVVCIGLVALMAWPLVTTPYPPLLDYPNHLARTYILFHIRDVQSFSDTYQAVWLPYPNLAIDLCMLGLQRLLEVWSASRVFLVLLPLLFLLGAHCLARAIHGTHSWMVALASYFFFNTLFFYGFVNYVFGVAVYFFAFAAWIGSLRRRSLLWLVLSTVLALAAYLAHEAAFIFLGLSIVTWLVVEGRFSRATLVWALVPLTPPLVLKLVGGVPRASGIRWGSLDNKIKGVAGAISTYNPSLDVLLAALFFGGVGWAWWKSGRGCHRATFAVAGALAVMFVAFPSEVAGTWSGDRRFLIPAAVLTLLALHVDPRTHGVRLGLTIALLVAVVRMITVAAQWPAFGVELERRVAVLKTTRLVLRCTGSHWSILRTRRSGCGNYTWSMSTNTQRSSGMHMSAGFSPSRMPSRSVRLGNRWHGFPGSLFH